MQHEWKRCEIRTKFYWQHLRGRYNLEYVGAAGRIILKLILKKEGVGVRTAFICLRVGAGGGLL
jgi:hypothetical protein